MLSPSAARQATPLLAIQAVGKDYTATVLDGVNVELFAGEVLALTGENGAGKSTLSKILCGLELPTRGGMQLAGQAYAPTSRRDAERQGVRMVMQELGLVPTLTVAENLLMGRLPHRLGWLQRDVLHAAARAQLAKIGLDNIDPATPVSQLGIGQQQMVEIARNLQDDTRILVLDEPTAMLTPRETNYLFEQIAHLTARGVAIIYVSHRLEELRRIADRVAVLRDGRLVDVRPMAGMSEDDLVQRMVGRVVSDLDHRPRRPIGPVVMSAENLGRGTAVQDVNLELRAGEIFGIAGLVGSGRTELVRLLFGADRADRGSVTLHPEFRAKSAASASRSCASSYTKHSKTIHLSAHRTPHLAAGLCLAAAGHCRRSRPGHRRPQIPGPAAVATHPDQRHTVRPVGRVARRLVAARARKPPGAGLCAHAGHPLPQPRAARGAAVGRQPAKGGVCPLAAPRRPRAAAR